MQEFGKHDTQPEKYIKQFTGRHPKTQESFTCDVGYERFLCPEIFFSPDIYSADHATPLPQVRNQHGIWRLLVKSLLRGVPKPVVAGADRGQCCSAVPNRHQAGPLRQCCAQRKPSISRNPFLHRSKLFCRNLHIPSVFEIRILARCGRAARRCSRNSGVASSAT